MTELSPKRPLSPHIQVYRMTNLTSLTSILHRLAGMALCAGLVLLGWLLLASATGEEAFKQFAAFAASREGIVVFIALTQAVYYHLLTGARHLVFDLGYWFKIQHAEISGVIIILGSLALTGATWFYILKA